MDSDTRQPSPGMAPMGKVVDLPPGDERPSLSDLYDRYFEVLPARSPALLDEAHALRYQVYCVEHAFEDPAAQAMPGRERDAYDAHADHAVLIYRPSHQVVGCVRLILPPYDTSDVRLPMRDLLASADRNRFDTFPPGSTAEISRYAVSKMFRRREGETLFPDIGFTNLGHADARRLLPHMSLGLIRGVAKLAGSHGVTHLCAAMVPALMRLIERFGLHFEPLGPLVDYHGQRQPCIASVESLQVGLATRDVEYSRFVDAESKS